MGGLLTFSVCGFISLDCVSAGSLKHFQIYWFFCIFAFLNLKCDLQMFIDYKDLVVVWNCIINWSAWRFNRWGAIGLGNNVNVNSNYCKFCNLTWTKVVLKPKHIVLNAFVKIKRTHFKIGLFCIICQKDKQANPHHIESIWKCVTFVKLILSCYPNVQETCDM